MNRRKLAVSLVLALLIAALVARPAGARFDDVDSRWEWAQEGIDFLVERGVISGFPGEVFRPGWEVTRGQFIKMLSEICGFEPGESGRAFSDTSQHWAGPHVQAAVEQGVVRPEEYGANFEPDRPITRMEMARFTVRAVRGGAADAGGRRAEFTDTAHLAAEDQDYIAAASEWGIITGYPEGEFRPDRTASRAEAAVILFRMTAGEIARSTADLDELLPDSAEDAIAGHRLIYLGGNHFIAVSEEPGEGSMEVTIGLDAQMVEIPPAELAEEPTTGEFHHLRPDQLADFAQQHYPEGLYAVSYSLGALSSDHLSTPEQLSGAGAAVHRLQRLYPGRFDRTASHWIFELAPGHWIMWRRQAASGPDVFIAFSASQVQFSETCGDEAVLGQVILVDDAEILAFTEESDHGLYLIPDKVDTPQ